MKAPHAKPPMTEQKRPMLNVIAIWKRKRVRSLERLGKFVMCHTNA